MDNIDKALIGLGILSLGYLASAQNKNYTRSTPIIYWPPVEETPVTDDNFKTYVNKEYEIQFSYPSDWIQSRRNPNKYVGASGFFEVDEVLSTSGNIENAVSQQIDLPFLPYGLKPNVQYTTLDGQPAGIIFASNDQNDFFVDRECAVIVRRPYQDMANGFFRYVIIWTTPDYLPNILNSFKFVNIKR